VLCSFVLLAIAAVAQDAKPNAPDPSSLRPVSILFSATDSSGDPVRDLAKDEVIVLEDNRADGVADLRPVSGAPLSVGIVLMSSKDKFANDQAFVVTAGGTKAWGEGELRWESNRDTLIKIINSLDKDAGIPDAFDYTLSSFSGETPTSGRGWSIEGQQGGAANVFGVAWAMMMADRRPARRVLVMFRTPWAHAPGPTKSNADYVDQKHMEIIKEAQRLHVSIFTIGLDEGSPATNPDVTALQSNYAMNAFGDMSREYDRQYLLLKQRLYDGGPQQHRAISQRDRRPGMVDYQEQLYRRGKCHCQSSRWSISIDVCSHGEHAGITRAKTQLRASSHYSAGGIPSS
jgi:hypothetical protein